jgi:hypothetical protein
MLFHSIKSVLFTFLVSALWGCGQQSNFQSVPNNSVITDDITVSAFCRNKEKRRVQQTLVFAPDTVECAWGEDGNLPQSSGAMIAAVQSYTQSINLGVPVASICDFSLSMNEEYTVYDDDITFSFDEFAFAGDFLHREWLVDTAGLDQVGSLLRYDRLKVIGKNHPGVTGSEEWLEAGITGDFNTRQNAATQREGNFNLQLTNDFLDLMPRVDLTRQVHEFGFHIFGNHGASDCQHQGFTIDVDISFVPLEAGQ